VGAHLEDDVSRGGLADVQEVLDLTERDEVTGLLPGIDVVIDAAPSRRLRA